MIDTGRHLYPPAVPGALARVTAKAVAAVFLLVGKGLIGLRMRRAPEGWRRTVGILLRSECTRFALSAFGLRTPGIAERGGEPQESFETRTARALQAFLTGEPDAHFALEWRRWETLRRSVAFVDVVILRFARDGTLEGLRPSLAAAGPPPPRPDVCGSVEEAIVTAYNRTATLPEIERPRQLLEQVRHALSAAGWKGQRHPAQEYASRLLSACCLSFEEIESSDARRRFCPPDFGSRRSLGFGYLSCVARAGSQGGSVDVWASAHHVGLDGVPLQELLNRLGHAWGTAEAVTFPAALSGTAFVGPQRCQAPGERPVDQIITFLDLSPVFALRQLLNDQYAGAVGGGVTFGALMAWLISQEPEFAGVRIASTVDVHASGGYERDVDVVPLRPADYVAGSSPWDGFVEFAREFNRLVTLSRARSSPLRMGMQTAGLLPAWAHATLVRSNPSSLDDTFGSLCITIVRDARVFVAPMTDLGLGHGFLAIGSAGLPSADGRPVTSVSIKGDAGRIAQYPAILQRVIERAVSHLPTGVDGGRLASG